MFLGPFCGWKVLKYYGFGHKRVVSPYRESFRWWPYHSTDEAECLLGNGRPACKHDVPTKKCTCGFYAYAEFPDASETCQRFNGAHRMVQPSFEFITLVAGWGRVVTHDKGFRTSRMQIVAIHKSGDKSQEHLKEVAEDLGVPMMYQNGMEDYAQEVGVLLTEDTMP